MPGIEDILFWVSLHDSERQFFCHENHWWTMRLIWVSENKKSLIYWSYNSWEKQRCFDGEDFDAMKTPDLFCSKPLPWKFFSGNFHLNKKKIPQTPKTQKRKWKKIMKKDLLVKREKKCRVCLLYTAFKLSYIEEIWIRDEGKQFV